MAEDFDPEHSSLVRDVGGILRVVKALQVVPAPLTWLAAAVIATLYYFLRRIDLVELLKRWHEATKDAPAADPEKWIGGSPPIPVQGDPHTGEMP